MSRKKVETRELPCKLTDEELLKYGKEFAESVNKLNRLEDSKKSYVSQIKAQIESAQAQVNLLSNKIATGEEYRKVECNIKWDWVNGEKSIIRTDTGEIVQTVIITEEEKQEQLDFEKAKKERERRKKDEENSTGEDTKADSV